MSMNDEIHISRLRMDLQLVGLFLPRNEHLEVHDHDFKTPGAAAKQLLAVSTPGSIDLSACGVIPCEDGENFNFASQSRGRSTQPEKGRNKNPKDLV